MIFQARARFSVFDPLYLSEHEASIDEGAVMRLPGILALNNVKDRTLIADLKRDRHLYITDARGF